MEANPIKALCIVGAGFMGAQIGLRCAVHGYPVWLVDVSDETLGQAIAFQSQELDRRLEEGLITSDEKEIVLERIHRTTVIEEGVAQADLVIEAIPERLEAKREVFARLDAVCPSHTILATNSSSLRISTIEDVTRRPDRVLNMHFFAIVWERPMVELMRGTATSDQTMERARQFARTIDMVPLIVRRESTGFIYNRVWRAIKKECLQVVDSGVATHADVDRAWMIAVGMPVGPFGLMDMIGLDVVRDIEMVYYGESGDEADAPPKLLLDMIGRGELGIKTGKGFYTYPGPAFEDPAWLKGGSD